MCILCTICDKSRERTKQNTGHELEAQNEDPAKTRLVPL